MSKSVKDFIAGRDSATRDVLAANSAVAKTQQELTDEQKAQAESQSALDDASKQLEAVVSAFPDGVVSDDGRFFEYVRGVGLKESTPKHADQIQGDIVKNPDGSYVFNPVDSAPEPAPATNPDQPSA